MKVQILLSVDIDPEMWAEIYGETGTANEIRADVKMWAKNEIETTLRDNGVLR